MNLLLALALSIGVGSVPAAADQPCTSNITVSQIEVNGKSTSPTPQLVGDTLLIRVRTTSACPVQSVVAEAFGHSVSLIYDVPSNSWAGVALSIASNPHTPFTLTATVTDVNGTPGVGTRNLIHDTLPVLTVTAPVFSAVARPSLQVTVSCADDDPAGCSSVTMTAPFVSGNPTLASGVTGINQTISLAGYEGIGLVVRFVATDSRGQGIAAADRFVFVESNPYLEEVATAPGTILDDSPDRTLFLADDMNPSVREKDDGEIVQLTTAAVMPSNGHVTSHGALVAAKLTPNWHLFGWKVFELRDGAVTMLGETAWLQVKGNYALVGGSLGDLAAGTWQNLSLGGTHHSVGPNGDVVYASSSPPRDILRYRDGSSTQLTFAGNNAAPDTDGVNVVYQQTDSNGDTIALRLVTSGGDILLSDSTYPGYFATPERDYVTNGGWTAFTKPSNVDRVLNVWRRAPDGTISQVSFFGSDAKIDALNSDGSVSIRNLHRLWLASPSGAMQNVSQFHNGIGSHIGTRGFFRDGDLHVLIGASVFKVLPSPDQIDGCASNITFTQVEVNGVSSPAPPQVVSDNLLLRARLTSACQLQAVVAEAFGHSVPLLYHQPSNSWTAALPIAGDPSGPFTLTVTATDINSTQAVGTRSLIRDALPVLTITAPVFSAVARPSLQVIASCTDDNPAGCSSVTMTAPFVFGNPTLASGVTGINQTISLAGFEGQRLVVRFTAFDSRGQSVVSGDRSVLIESSPHLVEVANAPGTVLDDSPDRTLFLGSDMHPSVLEKSNGQIVQLATSTVMPPIGRVTNHGALALSKTTPAGHPYWDVLELRDGVVTSLPSMPAPVEMQVKSNYALVGGVHRGDLDAGTWQDLFTPSIGQRGNSVGPNGDVVYWRSDCPSCEIFRYRDGSHTQLTFSGSDSRNPDTDGVNVAYLYSNSSGTRTLRLITSGGDVLLSDFSGYAGYTPTHLRDYVTNGEWTAFTRPAGGVVNVWRRAPDGTIDQVSFFGSNATVDALSSDGAVSIRNAGHLWLASPGSAVLQVSRLHQYAGTPEARSFFRDGDLYVLIGASVFKVVGPPTITAQPSNQTAAFGQTATFNVTVSGTGPFTYQWYTGTSGTTTNPIAGATSSSYTTPHLTSPTRVWVRVSSLTGSVNSADAVVIMPFTDDPLLAGVTMIKAVHVAELRTRIDAVRAKFALGAFAYSEPAITVGLSLVRAQAILELRAALTQAYTAAGQTPPSYGTSAAAGMPILAADIASLRLAIVAIE